MHQHGVEPAAAGPLSRVRTRLAKLGRSTTEDVSGEDATRKHLLKHLLRNPETESDTESYSRLSADEEDSEDEPKSRKRPPLSQRSATLAECIPQAPLSCPEDIPSSNTDVPMESLLEKLGQRIRERSDKVHKVIVFYSYYIT